jgi:hypothetical protein
MEDKNKNIEALEQQYKAEALREQASHLSDEALASLAADDPNEAQRLDDLATARKLDADLIGGSIELTAQENQQLRELSARFDRWMDDGQLETGGLTRREYNRLSDLLEKAGNLSKVQDLRR